MKDFDPYEYVGVIAPGAVIAIGIFVQWPAAKQVLLAKEFSLGQFGIFLIFAFIIGHLVQALGNGIERLFFAPVGGMPTNWMLRKSCDLISPSQRDRVFSKISLAQNQTIEPHVVSKSQWYALTREIYALVAAAGRSDRIDAFNRNYGLMRGIASGFCILAIWLLFSHWPDWRYPTVAAGLAAVALYRMGHFAKLYAREVFVQYLAL